MTTLNTQKDVFAEPSIYVSTTDVCRRYKLSKSGIQGWIRRRPNGFPLPLKLGARRNCWLKSDLLAWVLTRHADRKPTTHYVQPAWAKPREARDEI